MKRAHLCGSVAAWCLGLFFLAVGLRAQDVVGSGHVGVPQDWSEHSIVFTLDGLARDPSVIDLEPRVRHQLMQRFPAPGSNRFQGVDDEVSRITSNPVHRDWNVALGKGRVAANQYPAKFSFNPGAPPSCTADYVVFGLATAGATGGQANLVAFNNLYAGTGGYCGSAPTVMFAYNTTTATGGKISLSPVISEDGTKIAFVETLGTSAVFHVLTWTSGQGGITTAVAPTAMTSLTFSSAATDTTSAPWVDYGSDTAYVGANGGLVYKITGVFKGTPTLAGSPWPVTVSAGHQLSSPVLDNRIGMLMVGSANGNLNQVNIATGAVASVVVGAHGGTSPGVTAPPVVDVTNETTFVVSANGGSSAVLDQVNTFTLSQLAEATIGLGASGGTALSIGQPAFNNAYYNNPSGGDIEVCGTGAADTTPWHYAFSFNGTTMNGASPASKKQLLTSTGATCTNWTEFYNPNVNGGTDFFFFGLTQDCSGTGTSGCVVAFTSDSSPLVTANVSGGPSGIQIDNYSTVGQASSIYLTGESVNTAYKFTQNGLQ